MEANKADNVSEEKSFKDKHGFSIFITGSVIISILIVVISMTMYNGSGAAQLDLSRPGYVSVRSQATEGEGDFKSYSATGKINKSAIEGFIKLFDTQAKKLEVVDAFGGSPSPLSPVSLGIDDPASSL